MHNKQMDIAIFFTLLINPIVAIPLVLYSFILHKRVGRCTLYLAFICGYIAFISESNSYGDLERYMAIIVESRGYPFYECADKYYDGLYVINFLFWLSGKCFSERCFVFFTAFIVYGSIYYIMLDLCATNNLKKKTTIYFIIVLTLFIPFCSIVTSARSSMALMIGLLAIYQEYVKKRIDFCVVILYLIPIYIHQACILIYIIRLLFFLPNSFNKTALVLVFFLIFTMGTGLFDITTYIHFNKDSFLGESTDLLVGYSAYGEGQYTEWQSGFRHSLFNIISKGLYFIPILSIIINGMKKNNETRFNRLIFTSALFIFPMFFYPTNFYLRYVSTFSVLFGSFILLNYRKKNEMVLLFYSIFCFLLQARAFFSSVPYDLFLNKASLGIFYYF